MRERRDGKEGPSSYDTLEKGQEDEIEGRKVNRGALTDPETLKARKKDQKRRVETKKLSIGSSSLIPPAFNRRV